MPATLREYVRYTSWPIILAMLGLMAYGLAAIHVAEQADATMRGYTAKQAVFAAMGLAAFALTSKYPYQKMGHFAYPLFGVTLFVLVVLILPKYLGSNALIEMVLPEIRGSRRWINFGFMQLQPSELAKITYVMMLAWYLRKGDHYRRLRGLMVPFVLTFVPMGLILIEPDLGTSLLFLPTLFGMLFMAGAKLKHLLGVVALVAAVKFLPVIVPLNPERSISASRERLAYFTFDRKGTEYAVLAAPLAKMAPHQIVRIEGWLVQDPDDPAYEQIKMDQGYHLYYSKLVLGAGRWAGRGEWNQSVGFFRMLPDDHTDFIFSVIGSQWGFVGALGLMLLYGVIFIFGLEIALVSYDPFGRLLAVGVLALLFSQIFINVGMTMGLMPITGMTLPLVSYGGSSLLVNCIAMGLLVNVSMHQPVLLSRRPFEHGPKREKAQGPEKPALRSSRSRENTPADREPVHE